MKHETYHFKQGEKYHVDQTSYIFSSFGRCFKNIDSNDEEDDMSDSQICLKDCSVTIRTDDVVQRKVVKKTTKFDSDICPFCKKKNLMETGKSIVFCCGGAKGEFYHCDFCKKEYRLITKEIILGVEELES